MKTIGMVGGTGWVSTLEYYRLINELTNKKLGGLNAARIILYSVNYGDIDELNRQNNREGVCQLVLQAARSVERAGAGCLMLCANTMHQFADQIRLEINLPLVHIGEETAKTICKAGYRKVGLLGTKFTMELDFYHAKLKDEGLESIVPDESDRIFINEAINKELLLNRFYPETKKRFLEIIGQLKERGAEAIILGCTEIPLLIKQEDVDLPIFNTLEIHARAAVEFAL
jgi:aspartate racemase